MTKKMSTIVADTLLTSSMDMNTPLTNSCLPEEMNVHTLLLQLRRHPARDRPKRRAVGRQAAHEGARPPLAPSRCESHTQA